MNKKTLKALNGSIAKWEAIVDGTGRDEGAKNCPLCAMFLEKQMCRGCPVSESTGRPECWGSPYQKWREVAGLLKENAHTPSAMRAAKAELDFLKSLLPK